MTTTGPNGYIGILEKRRETVGIIGYILGYRLGLYWDNGKKVETTIMGYIRFKV